ncbi:MAG: PQQ-dependent sugar dehydrogenase [Gammaproteobacteria bacterium]|nr:PQQ-dependent sugar dehydrogenase [Gammaproteobacteria bacterium]
MKKWLIRILGSFVAILVLLLILVRIFVGAVNVPMGSTTADRQMLAERIVVPAGFSMGLWAADVPNARVVRFSRAGDLLVANPGLDQVVLLKRDADGDGKSDGKQLVIDGLNSPNGLDFYADWLYIAEEDAIGRVKFDHDAGQVIGSYERIVTGLPGGGNHYKKTLKFGPDGLLYLAFGSSCNVCIEEDPRRAAILRYQPDGSGEELFATGLRNSAGFDWSPIDGHLYATDNGRDLLGDDFPPCELNRIEQGEFYGWPYANGDRIPDPDFGDHQDARIAASIAPVHNFRAHNAPLGITFIRNKLFPEEYRGAAVVALHGSWNRTSKDGYKVVSLHWNEQGEITERDFVTGFLKDDQVIGRPAELTEGPDGAIYIADDYAGAIYRVTYGEHQSLQIPVQIKPEKYDPSVTLAILDRAEIDALFTQGEALFQQHQCVSCHNDQPDGKKLSRVGFRYDLNDLRAHFIKPPVPMPVFPLSDADRKALAVYVIKTY